MDVIILALILLVLSVAAGLAPRLAVGSDLDRNTLQRITSLASGMLLASALLVVVPEGFALAAEAAESNQTAELTVAEILAERAQHSDHDNHDHSNHGDLFVYHPAVLGLIVLAGFLMMLTLEGFGIGHAAHEEHHDHAEEHGHSHVHHPSSLIALALGLSVHAAADGLAIGSALAGADAAIATTIVLAVLFHKLPAAFSLGAFSLHHRGPDQQRLVALDVIGFSLMTPALMLLSYWLLGNASDGLVAGALLFAAGTFVYVATVDGLPEVHNPETGRRAVAYVLIGAVLFTIVLLILTGTGLLVEAH